MAEQGTEEKTASAGGESAAQDAASGESTGRHAANDEATGNAAAEAQAPSEDPTEKHEQPAEQKTEKSAAPSEQKTEKHEQPAEQKTEKTAAPAEQKTERIADDGSAAQRGRGDTSWAEPERPSGSQRHRSIDVGELAWRTGNVLATVVRTLALLFALVLVVNVVLVLVGVNPANGVAQFVGAVADIVILGFRDLFVPANPTVMLIVNSLIAAVFWAFVGELASRLIRFLAARLG
ncbi:hypothetical protein [Actinomycetospora sp. TBRC 11914]|uniref:hypothetical protein n=1 Tax=Actinomycetospora sp. TBRC 11914 TaxID=2729387 RepID=UPI00145C59E2|nr:hypothetical protein [Actinomycetospora sp. TBRC 11914]NMO90054.1 hypothetical protein [Actinomycetospora sp. TBRC 11914]